MPVALTIYPSFFVAVVAFFFELFTVNRRPSHCFDGGALGKTSSRAKLLQCKDGQTHYGRTMNIIQVDRQTGNGNMLLHICEEKHLLRMANQFSVECGTRKWFWMVFFF